MDRYRIRFTCVNPPEDSSKLKGFSANAIYEGRTYNGLIELSPQWGDGRPTKIISAREFNKYFQLVDELKPVA